MREAWIIDAVRTPIGRHGGALAPVRPDDLAAVTIEAIIQRSDLTLETVDDVIFGCINQAGEDNRNVARMALLRAGLPVSVAGQTVNRLCGSGMQAVLSAHQAIMADLGDAFICGGVESMSRAPYVMLKPETGYARGHPDTADTVLGWRFPTHSIVSPHSPQPAGKLLQAPCVQPAGPRLTNSQHSRGFLQRMPLKINLANQSLLGRRKLVHQLVQFDVDFLAGHFEGAAAPLSSMVLSEIPSAPS